jgi:hypothetical protein
VDSGGFRDIGQIPVRIFIGSHSPPSGRLFGPSIAVLP